MQGMANVLAAGALVVAASLGTPAVSPAPGSSPVPVAVASLVPAPVRLDRALGSERSLLSFLPDDVTSGRYAVRSDERDPKPAPRYRGVFWRTASGNAYLRTEPYDAGLVRREVEPLARRVAGYPADDGDFDPDRMYPLRRGTIPGSAEYQLPFHAFVADLLAPGIGFLRSYVRGEDCADAKDAHAEATRAAVAALRPEFRPAGDREEWTVDVLALRRATAPTRQAATLACEGNPDDSVPELLRVRRWSRGVDVVAEETGGYRPESHTIVEVTVRPGPVGPPPERPDPATGDPMLLDFLLAVAACRGLPWEYSNFAASDSYVSPASSHYGGPYPLVEEWVCAADVPASERADPDP